jgi:hypothetical protein
MISTWPLNSAGMLNDYSRNRLLTTRTTTTARCPQLLHPLTLLSLPTFLSKRLQVHHPLRLPTRRKSLPVGGQYMTPSLCSCCHLLLTTMLPGVPTSLRDGSSCWTLTRQKMCQASQTARVSTYLGTHTIPAFSTVP